MKTIEDFFVITTIITAILFILSIISLLRYCFNKKKKKTFFIFSVSLLISFILNIGLFFFAIHKTLYENIIFIKDNPYAYNLQDIRYNIKSNKYVGVGREINKPELFRLWYSVHKSYTSAFVTELSGKVVFIQGPPFSFKIILRDVNENIKSVHLKNCIILTSKENNILELDDISITYELLFSSTSEREALGKTEEENDYQLFRTNGIFYSKDKLEKIAIEQMVDRIISRRSLINFENIPIDYLNDKTFIIRAEIMVIMEDEEEFIIEFEDEYMRILEKEKIRKPFPPGYYKEKK
jgi:hypothetical protein